MPSCVCQSPHTLPHSNRDHDRHVARAKHLSWPTEPCPIVRTLETFPNVAPFEQEEIRRRIRSWSNSGPIPLSIFSPIFFSHFLRSRTRVESRYLPAQHPGGLVQNPPFARPHFFFGTVDNNRFCERHLRRKQARNKSETRPKHGAKNARNGGETCSKQARKMAVSTARASPAKPKASGRCTMRLADGLLPLAALSSVRRCCQPIQPKFQRMTRSQQMKPMEIFRRAVAEIGDVSAAELSAPWQRNTVSRSSRHSSRYSKQRCKIWRKRANFARMQDPCRRNSPHRRHESSAWRFG